MLFIFFIKLLLDFQVGQLTVLPTKDLDVFRLIYQGDMKWHIDVSLLNAKGRVVFRTEIKDTDSFLLSINMGGQESGTYKVKASTAAYDLEQAFEYLSYVDQLKDNILVEYAEDLHVVRVICEQGFKSDVTVYIYTESKEKLIEDQVEATDGGVMRIYNLRGAPARQLMTQGVTLRNEHYDF